MRRIGALMVCLFHGDYGPADPTFSISGSMTGRSGWTVDISLLRGARNLDEAHAIQRHVLRGEAVKWCHQGYSWVDQEVIGWFYMAAFLFVVFPYFLMKINTVRRRFETKAENGPVEEPAHWP